MRRSRRGLLAAVSLLLLAAACGSGEATQESVRNDVTEDLLARPDNELTEEQASDVGDCVAQGMFAGDFTPEERDAATSQSDAEVPDEELAAKVQALLDDCLAGGGTTEGGAQTSEEPTSED
jgi:hypothetical protein